MRQCSLSCFGAVMWLLLPLISCSPVELVNFVTPKSGYQIERDIAYGDNPRQTMDIYKPENLARDAPAILFFYGGRWQFGEKSNYLFAGQALSSRGYLTLIANYRLYPEVRWDGMVDDAFAALAKAQDTAAGRKIVLAGHSAGAYLAAMAALDDTRQQLFGIDGCTVRSLVGLAGPYNFLPLVEEDIIEVFGPGQAGIETQPIAYVTPGDPPALLLTGTADETVRPGNSSELADALRSAGVRAEARLLDDVGHVGLMASFALPTRFLSPALEYMVDFIEQAPVRTGC